MTCVLLLQRAPDRSWKQVWAVVRGPVLSLCKERAHAQHAPHSEVSPVVSDRRPCVLHVAGGRGYSVCACNKGGPTFAPRRKARVYCGCL